MARCFVYFTWIRSEYGDGRNLRICSRFFRLSSADPRKSPRFGASAQGTWDTFLSAVRTLEAGTFCISLQNYPY